MREIFHHTAAGPQSMDTRVSRDGIRGQVQMLEPCSDLLRLDMTQLSKTPTLCLVPSTAQLILYN
jgi:hypothetical protein